MLMVGVAAVVVEAEIDSAERVEEAGMLGAMRVLEKRFVSDILDAGVVLVVVVVAVAVVVVVVVVVVYVVFGDVDVTVVVDVVVGDVDVSVVVDVVFVDVFAVVAGASG